MDGCSGPGCRPLARRAGESGMGGEHIMSASQPFDPERKQFLRIDGKKQIFLDDRLIEEVRNLRRVSHHPVKHPGNPLMKQDQPWEKAVYFRTSNYCVQYDAQAGRFKCWYEDLNLQAEKDGKGQGECGLLYAESRDGLRWEKPLLDRVLFKGQRTNILLGEGRQLDAGTHSATVLYDPVDSDPARRFKMVYNGARANANLPKKREQRTSDSFGLCIAFSPDGIDWTPYAGNPIREDWGSDVEVLTYDPIKHKYTVYGRADAPWFSPHPAFKHWFPPVRPNDPRGATYAARLVFQLESEDAIHWTEPVLVFAPDKTDNLDDQHYCLTTWRADDYYLGLLLVIHNVPDTVSLQFAWSYDGIHWNRTQERPDVIPLGTAGSYDSLMAECPTPPITVGDEHLLFYGGSRIHHDWWCPPLPGGEDEAPYGATEDEKDLSFKSYLCLAKIGVDRWVSLTAMAREGYVHTFPVFSTGSKLIVNGRCGKDGFIAAEITDNWNNVWSDFSRATCDVFTGDSARHVFSWRGRTDVNMIPGIVKVKFYLRNADLYSFRIADA
jgi:hypothetical protein